MKTHDKKPQPMEGELLARAQGIVGVVELVSYDEHVLRMRYVEGVTLLEYLKGYGPLAKEEALAILLPLTDTLSALHKRGILHRDISPANIHLGCDGQIVLLDFGAACEIGKPAPSWVKKGYSPPEQYRDGAKLTPAVDVYALAATVHRALTGRFVLDGLSHAFLAPALCHDPQERTQTMKELKAQWEAQL